MKEKKTVGIITASNPADKRSWSGTHYRMYQSLAGEFEEVYLFGPMVKSKWVHKVLDLLSKVHRKLFSRRYNKHHNLISGLYYARQIKAKLRNKKIDILFAPSASTEISCLKTALPLCYLADASFGQIHGYYEGYSGFSEWSVKESNWIEKKAINNSTTQVYSSDWAADFAIKQYNAKPENVFTVAFGANIDDAPDEKVLVKEFNSTVNLLFLGVDWKRKGGDLVLEAFQILTDRGHDVTLTICGCAPVDPVTNSRVRIIPFLNKNNPDEARDFLDILQHTHLLFVPTRADCTPIVFCEANAYGIPVITTDTGGVSSLILNNVNGFALPYESTPEDYADKIQTLLLDRNNLKALSVQARQKFDSELNWEAWGKRMREILLHSLDQKQSNKN